MKLINLMKLMKRAVFKPTAIVILTLGIVILPTSAVVFCPDDRHAMPMQITLPWSAIGYLDNGCTAVLIDSQHIVAAAHCFVWDTTGKWQKDLLFYPNYHPQRPNPPSVAIDRVVVGTRVETGAEFQASDWGIAHLASPITDFEPMPVHHVWTAPWDVLSAGYARDSHLFNPLPPPPGGVSKMGSNVWWQYALVDPGCKIYEIKQDQLFFDCAALPGNSGAPIFYSSGNTFYIAGIIHGGPYIADWHGWWNIPGIQTTPDAAVSAAARGPTNLDVFLTGQDGGIYTAAWGPQTNHAWKGWWRVLNLNAQPGSYVSAVSRSTDWLDIFVVDKNGGVYTAAYNPNFEDGWHGWWHIPGIQVLPGTPVSAAARSPYNLDVFVVGQDGGIYTAAWGPQTNYTWKGWWRVLNLNTQPGSYVSAVSRSTDWLDIFVVDKNGGVYTAAYNPNFEDGWHGWWHIPGIQALPGTPVSAAARSPYNLDVFVVGQDGGIYTAAWGPQTNYTWKGWWRVLNLQVQPGSYVSVVSRGNEKLDIFVVGMDHAIYATVWDPKIYEGWRGWVKMMRQQSKPGSFIGALSRGNDWLDVFVVGPDEKAYTAAWHPGFTCEDYCGRPTDDRLSVGPSAKRFLNAPRFARNVALSRYPGGPPRTQVFATDLDSDAVVTRYRSSTQADDGFLTYWKLGTVPKPLRITAFEQTNHKPQIVVTSTDGKLYTKTAEKDSASWNDWAIINNPPGIHGFLDIDAAYDSKGTNQIYVIGDDNNLYTRRRVNTLPDSPWANWERLTTSGTYRRVTAIRRADSIQQVFLISSAPGVGLTTLHQTQATPTAAWSQPVNFAAPTSGMIIDIDASLTEDEAVQLFAVDVSGKLYIQKMISKNPSQGWHNWSVWDTHLYAPAVMNPQPPPQRIDSLTASRWQEENGGDIIPVVFATDHLGNIYYTTHGQSSGWSHWKSFYH